VLCDSMRVITANYIINIETIPPKQIIAEKQGIVSCRHLTGSRM